MKTCTPYHIRIFCGLKEGYGTATYNIFHSIEEVKLVCQAYCDKIGFGVSVTPTNFVYTGGHEEGVIVGIMNYPRFPKSEEELKIRALEIAQILLKKFNQERLSIEYPDKVVMLEKTDLQND